MQPSGTSRLTDLVADRAGRVVAHQVKVLACWWMTRLPEAWQFVATAAKYEHSRSDNPCSWSDLLRGGSEVVIWSPRELHWQLW
jgi:hypothetical protein